MTMPTNPLLTMALVIALILPLTLQAATEAELQRRLELLEKLDQLDQMDLDATLEKAEQCILKRNFNCAGEHLEDAKPFVVTPAQEKQVAHTRQLLKREIALVQREQAEARRLARERERLEREREREREELARLETEMQAEQERLAQEANSSHDPYDTGINWEGVMAFSNLYIESERAKNQQRAQQIAAQKRMERDVANRLAQQQQRIAAAQRDYQQRQREIQRQQQDMEQARQQRAQREQQRRRQLAQQRARQAEQQRARELERQRQARQSQLQQQRMAASNSNSSSSASTRNPDEDGPQYTGRLYEPNMVTMTGSMDSGFSDRDLAIAYARLAAVRDIDDECRDRGARSDAPRFSDIETGIAPTRWNYKTPDCKQGGWEDEEWFCTVEVSGTCYRTQ